MNLKLQPSKGRIDLRERLIGNIQVAFEQVDTALEEQQQAFVTLSGEVHELSEQKTALTKETDILRETKQQLDKENTQAVIDATEQLAGLKSKISNIQDTYVTEVQKLNDLRIEAEDEQEALIASQEVREKNLKERETALKAKSEALILQRQEFEIEKRRYNAEKVVY